MRSISSVIAIAVVLTALYACSDATAVPKVGLKARFSPDVLSQSTTLFYELSISEPAPVESINLRLPHGTNLAGSSLGLTECKPEILRVEGPEACPTNSIMGRGDALGGVLLASDPPRLLTEAAHVTFALGPTESESANPTILILVEGLSPTYDMLLITSQLAPTAPPYSYALNIQVPHQQAWAEGPYIALLHLKATIGPQGITYHRQENGRTITYKPRGLTTPPHCPPKGFPFEADFHFYNGETATAHDLAPCPSRKE